MALIKCKECGEQVSTSAQSCPKCGAKLPKKTSIFTWLILIFIIIVVFTATRSPSTTASSRLPTTTNSTSSTSPSATLSENAPPPVLKPQWATSTTVDKMTGGKKVYATSPIVGPAEMMQPPYNDVSAWLGVGCDRKSQWVFIGFSTAPNLTNTEIEDGYNIINTRIKWDKTLQNVTLSQEWGAQFLHFANDRQAISKITSSSTALLELSWYGQNHPYFSFPLDGATTAIASMKKQCSGK